MGPTVSRAAHHVLPCSGARETRIERRISRTADSDAQQHRGDGQPKTTSKPDSGTMNRWEKLTEDLEVAPRFGSPLARAAAGFGLLFCDLHRRVTGSIRDGKGPNATFIHFADHPKTFVRSLVVMTAGMIGGLMTARQRYPMHNRSSRNLCPRRRPPLGRFGIDARAVSPHILIAA